MEDNFNKGVAGIILEAELNREDGKYLVALEKYNQALYFLNTDEQIQVLFSIADIYSELENYKEAYNSYKKILALDYNSSGAWYGLAFTNELIGKDIKESLRAYNRAIEIDKNYKEAYYYAATIYGDFKDYKMAEEYLKRVIEIDPEDFIAYNDLGSIYEVGKNYSKAIECLEKSIKLNDEYYLSHFNLGVVLKAMGNYEMALKEYKKAALFSDSMYIYLNMSAIFIEEKKFDESVKILDEGISRKAHHVLYYNRACSYRKMGNIKKALEDFNKAKNLNLEVVDWAKRDPDLKDIIQEEV